MSYTVTASQGKWQSKPYSPELIAAIARIKGARLREKGWSRCKQGFWYHPNVESLNPMPLVTALRQQAFWDGRGRRR